MEQGVLRPLSGEIVEKTSQSKRPKLLKKNRLKKNKSVKVDTLPKRKVELTDNARTVLAKRYLKKNAEGEPVETVEAMFMRVCTDIAEAESLYRRGADPAAVAAAVAAKASEFYDTISTLEFLPNSPTLMNAGRTLQQLSACFVLPVEDSMESIFEAIKNTALIHKSGGGTGFSFSSLRPSGDIVGSTSGISSGPISFMKVFDSATEAIKQGGTRRGANMGMLRVDHPDIETFITCKEDNQKLNNFNISVAVTDSFMEAVSNDTEYDLLNPRTRKVERSLSARGVFEKIVNMAWKNGDPGVVFIDRINQHNPTPHIGAIDATNPCGEQPLLPNESCNLGSINLSLMVTDSGDVPDVDWPRLERTTRSAVHFLDNVIDRSKYPIEQIGEMTKRNRKIGLGVMGFSDMLIRLGIPYDSERALDTADKVMAFVQEKGREVSMELAHERGSFPNHQGSVYDDEGIEIRNATVTTIAPTGTISIIAGCSSGIEPLFALAFTRNVMDGTELVEVNPLFEEYARKHGFYSPELIKKVADSGGVQDLDEVPDGAKRIFVTAHDITPEWHIRMQSAFQNHTDNAVSKTVNFHGDATVDDVADVYTKAFELGCKGVTVYRDGSRDEQVLTKGQEKKPEVAAEAAPLTAEPYHKPKPRGDVAFGVTKKMVTGCGNLYVTINEDPEGRPFEIFTQIGKAGGCATSQCEAIGRIASLALRGGIDPDDIITQMRGISCHLPVGLGGRKVMSCSDALAQAMDWYMGLKKAMNDSLVLGSRGLTVPDLSSVGVTSMPSPDVFKRGACPDCGGLVDHAEGCAVCRGCGYTEC